MFPLNVILVGCKADVLAPMRRELATHAARIEAEFDDVGAAVARRSTSLEEAGLVIFYLRHAEDLPALKQLTGAFVGWPVLALAAPAADASLVIRAMRAGASQVVHLPLNAEDFREALNCVGAPYRQSQNDPTVVAVLGPTSGCGTTALAVNLAWEIATQLHAPCVLAELSLGTGMLDSYLKVQPRFTTHELFKRSSIDLDQVKAILKAAKGDWRGAIMVALYTGARLQDVTDMRWESVDLQNKWIAFRAGKTRQRIKIPMHDALHDFLLELPAPDSGKAFLFPTLAGKRTGGKSGLSMAFKRIMERAKVRGEVVHERTGEAGRTVNTLSFHSFRHTLTSIMANAGVPVEVRQKFTGHASAEMNVHYTHHEIETLRSAIDKLPTLRP